MILLISGKLAQHVDWSASPFRFLFYSMWRLRPWEKTINVMTLGGLRWRLHSVDDATVEIENVHRNMGRRSL